MAEEKIDNNTTSQSKYDIFISWSNDKWKLEDKWRYVDDDEQQKYSAGALIAAALRHYLETILSDKKVYYSRDIKTGEWKADLMSALKSCQLSIFIATEPLLDSMWCLFEFGAVRVKENPQYIHVFNIKGQHGYDESQSIFNGNGLQHVWFGDSSIRTLLENIKKCFGNDFNVDRKLRAWNDSYANKVKEIITQIKTPYVRAYKLREQYLTLEKQKNEDINNICSEKDREISCLKEELKKYKTAKIEKLQDEISKMTSEIEDLKTNNVSLSNDNRILSAEKANLSRELKLKESKINEFSVSIQNLETEKQDLFAKLQSKEHELEQLKKLKEEDDFSKDYPIQQSGIPPFIMKPVKGGEFRMGSANGYYNEKPIHGVFLDNFYIGETQVTQGLWKAVMGGNPSNFKKGDKYPVECVTWYDAVYFCNKLSQMTGRAMVYAITIKREKDNHIVDARVEIDFSKNGFRLPTEAEWEYAAGWRKDGRRNQFSGCDDERYLSMYAWYDENSGEKTHPVATDVSPNNLGIYDMSGNVYEWCQDWYAADYYQQCVNNPDWCNNPHGSASGASRVLRGGSWGAIAGYCRVSSRGGYAPGNRFSGYGFRLLLSSPKKEKI